jgi:hypothetical protein
MPYRLGDDYLANSVREGRRPWGEAITNIMLSVGAPEMVVGKLAGTVLAGLSRSINWSHHVIPVKLFKELNLAETGFKLNHKKNLIDLPFPFHANHPSYTNYVRRAIGKKPTLENLIDLEGEMIKQINKIHGSGKYKKLNDYYKGLGF